MPTYVVTVIETRKYKVKYTIQAEDKQQAEEIALSGEQEEDSDEMTDCVGETIIDTQLIP